MIECSQGRAQFHVYWSTLGHTVDVELLSALMETLWITDLER
jgi:hypothetical protein